MEKLIRFLYIYGFAILGGFLVFEFIGVNIYVQRTQNAFDLWFWGVLGIVIFAIESYIIDKLPRKKRHD